MNNESCKLGKSIGLIAIAVSILASAFIFAGTADKFRIARQTMTVKGYAEQSIVADVGVWTGTLNVRATDLATGSQKLQSQLQQVQQFLAQQNLPDSAIQVNGVNLMPQYVVNQQGISTNELSGYQLSQQITVTDKPAIIKSLDQNAGKLIEQGIEISSWSPQYYYTELDKVRITMLGIAMKDAQLRAKTLAESSGGTLGSLRAAQQGVFQITPEYSTETSDSGFSDTSAINKKVKAVVTAEFTLNN
jgi:hypothetical protein